MSSDYCKRQTIRLVDRIDIITYNRSGVPAFAYGLRRGTQGSAFKGSRFKGSGFKVQRFRVQGSEVQGSAPPLATSVQSNKTRNFGLVLS